MLTELLEDYRTERGIRSCTLYRMGRAVAVYSEFIGHAAETADLARDPVNHWIGWMLERYSPKTAREFRGDLLAVWRYAADRDLCQYPARIRVVHLSRPIPVAWTLDEVRRMLSICPLVKHGDYLALLLTVAYETGLRRGDLLSLDARQIAPDGTVRSLQHKTSIGHACQLRADTAERLRLRGNLKPPVGVRRIYRLLEQVRERANVSSGAMQQMRRTGATQVEIQQPGAAQRFLGHETPGLAYRYYVDWSQVQRPVEPPKIW